MLTDVLREYDMEAKRPDDFMVDQFHLDSLEVHIAIQRMADARKAAMDGQRCADRLEQPR